MTYNPMARLATSDTSRLIVTPVEVPNHLNRYYGGHRRSNHPYISGYWYLLIEPPERLFGHGTVNTPNLKNTNASKWLHCTAESFTPPTRSLKKVEAAGMGGMKSYYVAGQDSSREFTITFKEYQELPIMTIMQNWTSIIDSNTGVSPLNGKEYIPANYKGHAFVALCKPTIGNRDKDVDSNLHSDDIEQLFYFTGVVPKSLPLDSLSTDISNNETLSISVAFSFDGYPLLKDTPDLVKTFIEYMNQSDLDLNTINKTYTDYTDSVTTYNAPNTRTITI